MSQTDSNVVISWANPNARGSAVTSYGLYLQGSSSVDSAGCTESAADILSTRICTIPMSYFTSTLSLAVGVSITAEIDSTNVVGTSSKSAVNTSTTLLVQNKPE